jgi:hypothetical protein
MESSWYIIITPEFAEQMTGAMNSNIMFNHAVTIDNVYVTAYGSLRDFPEEFAEFADGQPLQTVYLSISNFPQPE